MNGSQGLRRGLLQYAGMFFALSALVLFFSLRTKTFWSATTLTTIANSIPDLTVVAVGMTLILILGGIDLSVGSVMAWSGSVMAMLMVDQGWPVAGAVVAALLVGTVCGCINGWISSRFRIPSFIVTLGMLEIARGGAYLATRSETKYLGPRLEWLSEPWLGIGLSPAFWIAIAIVAIAQWLLHRTVIGRMAVAIGTNSETVRMSGLSTMPTQVAVFGLGGFLCGIAATIQCSRLSTADPNAGAGMELSAIAACVIGGTSLRGGMGSVISTFFGVLIVSVLQTGLAQMGASDPIKRIVTGSVIVLAVLLDSWRSRRS
jgi:ribose transport system permease protein